MKKLLSRVLAAAIAAVMTVNLLPATVQAKGETWIHTGDTWHHLQGTDIKVQIANDTIRVSGTGAVPDYDYWSLAERPWDKSGCHYLIIDDTVTSIGAFAFSYLDNLQHITISTKTFVQDATTFSHIAYKPIYRITGSVETTEMIGTIPYTSLDSLKAVAQTNYNGACYILDTQKLANAFQNSTNPTIPNVFYAGDSKAPWVELENNMNGNVATGICRLSEVNPDSSIVVTGQRKYPGKACYQAFAAFIGDNTFATTFSINVARGKTTITTTDTPLQYVLTIPAEYRKAGRSFKLLSIGNGVVNILEDLDSANETITFATNTPTTAYALVYKDMY